MKIAVQITTDPRPGVLAVDHARFMIEKVKAAISTQPDTEITSVGWDKDTSND